jgi:hypothetical protein
MHDYLHMPSAAIPRPCSSSVVPVEVSTTLPGPASPARSYRGLSLNAMSSLLSPIYR